MRFLTVAAVTLVAIASTAPAMAQAGPSAYEPPIAGRTPAANAAGSHLELLQGYGKNGEVIFTWYYVMPPDFRRYHGS